MRGRSAWILRGRAAAAHVRAYGFMYALCAALPMTTPARIDRRGFSKTVASCGVSCEVCVASSRAEERKRSRTRPWATDGGPGLQDALNSLRYLRAPGGRAPHAESGQGTERRREMRRPECGECRLRKSAVVDHPGRTACMLHMCNPQHNNLTACTQHSSSADCVPATVE